MLKNGDKCWMFYGVIQNNKMDVGQMFSEEVDLILALTSLKNSLRSEITKILAIKNYFLGMDYDYLSAHMNVNMKDTSICTTKRV